MEREQILRDDFQTVRKGWDPDEVREHLRAVANGAKPPSGTPIADGAAERVRSVIAEAETVAEELRAEARLGADELLRDVRAESEGLLASARAESERIVAAARAEASERVEQARAAVEGLLSQADDLRARVGTLGASGAKAEVPGPVVVPEPTPPTIPEPTPDPVPEPTPDPTPPAPDPEPEIDPPSPVPEPVPEPSEPAAAEGSASTEDLIAQLKGGSATNGSSSAPTATRSPSAHS